MFSPPTPDIQEFFRDKVDQLASTRQQAAQSLFSIFRQDRSRRLIGIEKYLHVGPPGIPRQVCHHADSWDWLAVRAIEHRRSWNELTDLDSSPAMNEHVPELQCPVQPPRRSALPDERLESLCELSLHPLAVRRLGWNRLSEQFQHATQIGS